MLVNNTLKKILNLVVTSVYNNGFHLSRLSNFRIQTP